jgi:hypothetical protein
MLITPTFEFCGYVAGLSSPKNATMRPSGDTDGDAYWPVCFVKARISPSPSASSGTTYRSVARSRSHVSWRWLLVTIADESGVQAMPLCWKSPGVRLRGVPVPSAATT